MVVVVEVVVVVLSCQELEKKTQKTQKREEEGDPSTERLMWDKAKQNYNVSRPCSPRPASQSRIGLTTKEREKESPSNQPTKLLREARGYPSKWSRSKSSRRSFEGDNRYKAA